MKPVFDLWRCENQLLNVLRFLASLDCFGLADECENIIGEVRQLREEIEFL